MLGGVYDTFGCLTSTPNAPYSPVYIFGWYQHGPKPRGGGPTLSAKKLYPDPGTRGERPRDPSNGLETTYPQINLTQVEFRMRAQGASLHAIHIMQRVSNMKKHAPHLHCDVSQVCGIYVFTKQQQVVLYVIRVLCPY